MTAPALTILLVDDHEVVRRGVAALLENHPGWSVVGEAADGRAAVSFAEEQCPDIVVMDIGMSGLNGFEATRRIRRVCPEIEVLILSMHESEQLVREVIAAGARGYVLKSDAGRQLVAAVEALARHQPFFTSRVAAKVFDETRRSRSKRPGRPRITGLTPREREVLQLLCEGHHNHETAALLGITTKTVETHRARIMRKVGLDSLAALVRYAVREGIVEP